MTTRGGRSPESSLTNTVTRSPEMAPRLVYRNKKYGRKSCPGGMQEKEHGRERRPVSLNYITVNINCTWTQEFTMIVVDALLTPY